MSRALSLVSLLALTACAAELSPLTPAQPEAIPAEAQAIVDASLDALEAQGRGLSAEDLVPFRVRVDALGQRHTRVMQTYEGLPVFGGEAIVHLDVDGRVRVTDKLLPGVQVDTTPLYSAEEALDMALTREGIAPGEQDRAPSVELLVYPGEARDHLAWRVALSRLDSPAAETMPVLFIDAHSGEVLQRYEDLQTATAWGSGTTNYYANRTFSFYTPDSVTFYMEDVGRGLGAFTANNSASMADAALCSDTDTRFNAASQYECSDAFYGLKRAYKFYDQTFGWVGIDGNGGPTSQSSATGSGQLITAVVNWKTSWVNATWNGSVMKFGDGNGTSYGPLTTLDVVGHEWTHGVVGSTAGLVYSNESGALNESYADIMGNMIERHARGQSAGTWLIAEDARLNGLAMRSFSDPTSIGNSRDHYDDRYTGANDNGGVHLNSGIQNLAFYLISEGGDHPTYGGRAVEGVGADDATDIAWRALTTYLTSTSDFADARDAWVDAAIDLYGERTAQWAATADAWALVGVGSAACGATAHDHQESSSLSGAGTLYLGDTAGFSFDWQGHEARVYVPATGSYSLSLEAYTPPSGWGNPGGWSVVASGTDQGDYHALSYSTGSWNQTLRWRLDYANASGDVYACYDQ